MPSNYEQALINAERECNKRVDIAPDKKLRPIGTIYREWDECMNSTDLPHWIWWKVVGVMESFKYRRGDTAYYERYNEIKGIEEPITCVT